ncbi:hypothetical protein C8A05DRAFT_39795, partial [Staphylotrichum tortipilum]
KETGAEGERRIWGFRRQVFWAGLAVIVFFLVVAVATGVGVGVGIGGKTSNSTPSATTTDPFPSATNTAPPAATSTMGCPSNNLTIFTASQPAQKPKKYLLLCNRDYNSNIGTTLDLYNTATDTLVACMELCAATDNCVGAGWGRGTCWLKSRLGEPNEAAAWSFLVEDS